MVEGARFPRYRLVVLGSPSSKDPRTSSGTKAGGPVDRPLPPSSAKLPSVRSLCSCLLMSSLRKSSICLLLLPAAEEDDDEAALLELWLLRGACRGREGWVIRGND